MGKNPQKDPPNTANHANLAKLSPSKTPPGGLLLLGITKTRWDTPLPMHRPAYPYILTTFALTPNQPPSTIKPMGTKQENLNNQLILAAFNGNSKECLTLFEAFADPNATSEHGMTPPSFCLLCRGT